MRQILHIKAVVLLPLAIILLFCSCNTTNDGESAYSAGSSVEEKLLDPYAAYEATLPSDFGQDPLDLYMIDRLHLIQGNDQRMFVWTPEGFTAMPFGYTSLEDLPAIDTSTNRQYHFGGRPVAGDYGLTLGLRPVSNRAFEWLNKDSPGDAATNNDTYIGNGIVYRDGLMWSMIP